MFYVLHNRCLTADCLTVSLLQAADWVRLGQEVPGSTSWLHSRPSWSARSSWREKLLRETVLVSEHPVRPLRSPPAGEQDRLHHTNKLTLGCLVLSHVLQTLYEDCKLSFIVFWIK